MSHVLHLRPSVPSGTHPIETGRYTLFTPPLGRFCDDLKNWVDNRAVGAIVTAPPRFGKSKGIRFAIDELRAGLGTTFPVLSFSCQDHQRPTEARFFESLLSDFGHGFSDRGSSNARQTRLIQFLVQQACVGHHRRLVLIADEAQKLQEPHYNWLVDIYNKLDRHDIATTVVLVGQPELIHQRAAFEKAKKMQIVGRFMVHLHEFAGLRNQKDFAYCLRATMMSPSTLRPAAIRLHDISFPQNLTRDGAWPGKQRCSGRRFSTCGRRPSCLGRLKSRCSTFHELWNSRSGTTGRWTVAHRPFH